MKESVTPALSFYYHGLMTLIEKDCQRVEYQGNPIRAALTYNYSMTTNQGSTLTNNDMERLAIEVISLAVKDAIRGSGEAREWLTSPDAALWLEVVGFAPEAVRRRLADLDCKSKQIEAAESKRRHEKAEKDRHTRDKRSRSQVQDKALLLAEVEY